MKKRINNILLKIGKPAVNTEVSFENDVLALNETHLAAVEMYMYSTKDEKLIKVKFKPSGWYLVEGIKSDGSTYNYLVKCQKGKG